jgi:hypothetical protein
MAQALISYTSHDRPKADKLRLALTSAGIDVWWDQKLIPGSTFPRVIADQIDASPCTLVLCSSKAMESHWVLAEANYAGSKVIPIIAEPNVKLIPPLNVIEGAQLLDWEPSPPAPEFNLLLDKIRSATAAAVKQPAAPENFVEIIRREHIRSWGWLVHEQLQDGWGKRNVEPPFLDALRQFLAGEAWQVWVKDKLQEAKRAAGTDANLAALVAAIDAVDCESDYRTILAGIRNVASDRNEKAVGHQLARIKSALADLDQSALDPKRTAVETTKLNEGRENLYNERRRLESLQWALRSLDRQAHDPEFRQCFLVTGFPGSGKTHLIASILDELAQSENKPDALVLVLDDAAPPTTPLDQLLLDELRRATRHEWNALDEFDQFVEHTYKGTRLAIVIENLERWDARRPGFVNELADWIYQGGFRSFRWLVTLNPAHYDKAANKADRWRELGWRRAWDSDNEYTNLSGWLDLDQANREEMTGVKILRKQLSGEPIALELLEPDRTR